MREVCVCVRALFHIQNGLLRRIQLVWFPFGKYCSQNDSRDFEWRMARLGLETLQTFRLQWERWRTGLESPVSFTHRRTAYVLGVGWNSVRVGHCQCCYSVFAHNPPFLGRVVWCGFWGRAYSVSLNQWHLTGCCRQLSRFVRHRVGGRWGWGITRCSGFAQLVNYVFI